MCDFGVPQPAIEQTMQLPLLGDFGFEVAANASFDYTLTDGAWELAYGAGAENRQGKRAARPIVAPLRSSKLKLNLGKKEITGFIQASARGTATVANGIRLYDISGSGGITSPKLEVWRLSALDLLGPGATGAITKIPVLGPVAKEVLGPVSIPITAQPSATGSVWFSADPTFALQRMEISGDIAIEASYEPDLGVAKARFYVGGKPGFTLQRPGRLIKELRFVAYVGAEFSVWVFGWRDYAFENVFVDRSYPSGVNIAACYDMLTVPIGDRNGPQLSPMDRSYLADGLARFVALESPWMNERGSRLRIAGEPQAVPVLADWPLIENVFPYSEPTLATDGHNLMLLYVSDNGSAGDLQFTDINWMWFDGANWTEPAAVVQDSRAEFAPHVAFDGSATAIAVWQRVKDSDFNTVDIEAMARRMEIVWARYDSSSTQWSEPIPLTDNNHLDHNPLLCGPLANGNLIAVWTENVGNQLMGNVDSADTVLWSMWNPASQTWSAPEPLVTDLSYRMSQSLSGTGDRAVYAWTRDMDGDPTTTEDQELFICSWDGQGWTIPLRVTDDATPDRNVRVAVSEANDVYLVWQRDGDLVIERNFTGISLVREDSNSVAFSDYAMTLGPDGNLVLLWQQQGETGVDPFYMVYDPMGGRWSREDQIFNDASLERSFAPIWDAAGNLIVAYNRVQMSKTSKVVDLPDGGVAEVNNIPTPGRVDLGMFKRRLAVDLGFEASDLAADGNDYLPGDNVILRATVRNMGDLSANDVTVVFYDGDPAADGVEIGRHSIAGWTEAGGTRQVEVAWHVPEPARPHTIFAVTDPNQRVQESNESNNELSIGVGGTDLSLALVSASAAADGSARVIVQVNNRGAPTAQANILAVRLADQQSAAPLIVSMAPDLAPGQATQLALDIPPATLTPGDVCLAVNVDDANEVNDVDLENNRVIFSVSCPQPAAPLPVPIAHWPFDEDTGQAPCDLRSGAQARVYGATSTPGVMGKALSFDGSDDYVDCGEAERFAPEKLTVSLWIWPEKSYVDNKYLAARCIESEFARDYTLALRSDSKVEFSFGENANDCVRFRSNGQVPLGEWTLVTATRNGTEASVYLNGELDSSAPYSFVPQNKGQGLKVGAGARAPWGYFKGKIDDVRIYDRGLTGEEVLGLYHGVSP